MPCTSLPEILVVFCYTCEVPLWMFSCTFSLLWSCFITNSPKDQKMNQARQCTVWVLQLQDENYTNVSCKLVEHHWYQTSESKSHTPHSNGAITPVTLGAKTVKPECQNVLFKAPISLCFSFCKFELSEMIIFL